VQQLLHGNGPVFHAGERIEATTSPLWVFVLAGLRLVFGFVPLGWIAVRLGLSLTVDSPDRHAPIAR
jgi:arabinofuranosyltransferase